jgi:hypothetical protein
MQEEIKSRFKNFWAIGRNIPRVLLFGSQTRDFRHFILSGKVINILWKTH